MNSKENSATYRKKYQVTVTNSKTDSATRRKLYKVTVTNSKSKPVISLKKEECYRKNIFYPNNIICLLE